MPTPRPFKGKHLQQDLTDYVVLDLETTGFSPANDDIVEVGALKVRDNEIVDTYGMLVKPNKPIPIWVSQKINIWNPMVASKPRIEQVLPEFLSFVGDDIVLGHNVNFDINFLYDKSLKYLNKPFTNDFVDYLKVSKTKYDLENYQLGTIARYLGIDASGAHRAVDDCVILHSCYTSF